MSKLNNLSYSGIRTFCNCRRAYRYKYINNLVPIHEAGALSFGKAWHEILAEYYTAQTQGTGIQITITHKDLPKLKAMFDGYRKWIGYPGVYGILGVELPLEIKIKPPYKGRAARGVRFRGIIDLVVERDDGIWIMEHKTASSIDGKYIGRLWHDLQIMLYAYAYQEMTGKKVTGIIYNIVKKTSIKQWQPSKTRKEAETDEHYQERLNKIYEDPDMYHREEILCDDRRLKEVRAELWDLTKEIRTTKNFYKNRDNCAGFGTCEYFEICNSGENPILIETQYKEREQRRVLTKKQNFLLLLPCLFI